MNMICIHKKKLRNLDTLPQTLSVSMIITMILYFQHVFIISTIQALLKLCEKDTWTPTTETPAGVGLLGLPVY